MKEHIECRSIQLEAFHEPNENQSKYAKYIHGILDLMLNEELPYYHSVESEVVDEECKVHTTKTLTIPIRRLWMP